MRHMLLIAALVVSAGCSQPPSLVAETPAELTAHGEYLVTRVAFCGDCHTPWVDGRPDAARALQGGPTGLSAPLAEYAPAIAGVPPHFTDEQMVQFLQTGVRPNGSNPRSPMPAYRFNERDARAITAYLNTIAPAAE